MSGACSAHRHYERECPLCQSQKPEWLLGLEARIEEREEAYLHANAALAKEIRVSRERIAALIAAGDELADRLEASEAYGHMFLPSTLTMNEETRAAWEQAKEETK